MQAASSQAHCIHTDVLLVVAGRIMCSEACEQASSGMQKLVQKSRDRGAIRLASPDFPAGFAVTVTAGQDDSPNSQTDTILPAAEKLLSKFANDYRDLASSGIVKLVPAFVYRSHPLWYFNQTHTFVLLIDVPSDGFVTVKVGPHASSACRMFCRASDVHLDARLIADFVTFWGCNKMLVQHKACRLGHGQNADQRFEDFPGRSRHRCRSSLDLVQLGL